MKRPLWIWFVVLASLFYCVTGTITGLSGLFAKQVATFSQQQLDSNLSRLSADTSSIGGMNLAEMRQRQQELLQNENYFSLLYLNSGIRFLIVLGFLVGSIQLLRMRESGARLLTKVYIFDIVVAAVVALVTVNFNPTGAPQNVLLFSTIGWFLFSLLLSGAPLASLFVCDRSSLEDD